MYTSVHWYTFYKVPEKQGHVYLVGFCIIRYRQQGITRTFTYRYYLKVAISGSKKAMLKANNKFGQVRNIFVSKKKYSGSENFCNSDKMCVYPGYLYLNYTLGCGIFFSIFVFSVLMRVF